MYCFVDPGLFLHYVYTSRGVSYFTLDIIPVVVPRTTFPFGCGVTQGSRYLIITMILFVILKLKER